MARARNIKPGFFVNEDLVELDFGTRLLFVGLWTLADREGRLEDRPKKIKIGVFPADNVDVEAMLQELNRYGFVERYEVNGRKYIQIANWSKHQNPHHTEKASDIPNPNGELTVKEPVKTKESRKQDGGNLADSLIPDSLIPDSKDIPPTPRKRGSGFDAAAIELPAWLDLEDWQSWVADRKARKKPITEEGARRQLKQLADYRDDGHRPADVIANSIAGGYQGLFPPRGQIRASPPTRAQAMADWNAELGEVLAEGRRASVIDMGTIDATH